MSQQFDVQVRVWLKASVFDPQGHAVENSLTTLGFGGVENVRIGKYMELRVAAANQADAEAKVRDICETVLCNPVMETYAFTMTPASAESDVSAESDASAESDVSADMEASV